MMRMAFHGQNYPKSERSKSRVITRGRGELDRGFTEEKKVEIEKRSIESRLFNMRTRTGEQQWILQRWFQNMEIILTRWLSIIAIAENHFEVFTDIGYTISIRCYKKI